MRVSRTSTTIAAAAAAGVLILGVAAPALAMGQGNGPQSRGGTTSTSHECASDGERSHQGSQGGERSGSMSMNQLGRQGKGRPDHAGRGQQGAANVELGSLDASQEATMVYMAEEEKMARDLYNIFFEEFGDEVFSRIAQSEERHLGAVQQLLEAYGVDDPTLGQAPGTFSLPELQAQYDAFAEEGLVSLEAAKNVGVQIEEADIKDIQAAIDGLDAPRAERVYANLLRGSERHLQAFSR